jgi:hypothetical protein
MTTRTSLFGGAALGALLALVLAPATQAATHHRHPHATVVVHTDPAVRAEIDELKTEVEQLKAQQDLQAQAQAQSQAQTQAQVQQLNSQLQAANARADQAEAQVQAQIQTIPGVVDKEVTAKTPKPGWWANTTISGRAYYDLTNIDQSSNAGNAGFNLANNGNHSPEGIHFDIKRLYIGVDHTFNDIFSANITTDFLYDSTAGATQLYLKEVYLQAKLNPMLTVRIGAADLPWVPMDEDVYGLRYVENTLIDRTKLGTSADWGVHALGSMPLGGGATFSYALSAIDGLGYKKPGFIGETNRPRGLDFEGRASVAWNGFTAAVGGYDGSLGADFSGVTTFHDAQRFDALLAYKNKWFNVGGEYVWANADVSAAQITTPVADKSMGYEFFGNIYLTPTVMLFGRYDWLKPQDTTHPTLLNTYYNLGVQWEPVKIVDFALVYKHDQIDHGAFADQNFATTASNVHASYDEVGVWGQFRW